MKISARNQFKGKIEAVKTGAVNSEVDLVLPGGQKIVAIVTNDSAKSSESGCRKRGRGPREGVLGAGHDGRLRHAAECP